MDGKAPIILVVDDEHAIVETLTDVLTYEGYSVISAQNGAKALAVMKLSTPDLVLLDFMMPVMDGVHFARALKSDPADAKIPVVMMTAAPAGLPKTDQPWDLLLIKPFDLEELLSVVSKFVGKAKP